MSNPSLPSGLETILIDQKDALVRFFRVRGAGPEAEDLYQELWIKVTAARVGPIASPSAYLYRAANALMIDRYRSVRQSAVRDRAWLESIAEPADAADVPLADRIIAARQAAELVAAALDKLEPHPRVAQIFRMHRVDGDSQRVIADMLGISISTVESDLRKAYRALAEIRETLDEV